MNQNIKIIKTKTDLKLNHHIQLKVDSLRLTDLGESVGGWVAFNKSQLHESEIDMFYQGEQNKSS